MSGLKLYEISNKYQIELDDPSGYGFLDSIEDELNIKAVNVAAYIKNLEAELSAIENAITDMKNRESVTYKKICSLKEYLLFNLNKCEIKEIKSAQFDIKVKKCPASVVIINDSIIDDEYKSIKEVTSIDKNKIKNDILNGVIVDGAEIVYNTRLEIK